MKIIVLGYNCNITFSLQLLQIKQENSVFEWWESIQFSEALDVLEKCLKKEPLVVEYGKYYGNHTFKDTMIRTSHYVGKTGEQSIDSIMERRAKRLQEYLMSDEKIIFLRNEESPNRTTFSEAKRFTQIVEQYNHSLEYRLLLLQKPEFPEKLETVLEFEDDPSKYIGYICECFGESPPINILKIDDITP